MYYIWIVYINPNTTYQVSSYQIGNKMAYEVILLGADIKHVMNGQMQLGLKHADVVVAEIDYSWDAQKFTATFHGHAPSLPEPMHPTQLIARPIVAINELKTTLHKSPSDVFGDHRIFISGS